MTPEERRLGERCRTLATLLDELLVEAESHMGKSDCPRLEHVLHAARVAVRQKED